MVAGYLDGAYAWPEAAWQNWPTAVHVRITVFAHDAFGDVLDVETGDATPAQAPGWLIARRSQGAFPSVYCNASTWPSVRAAIQAAGLLEPPYFIAQYDGDPTIPPDWQAAGCVAKQYQGGMTAPYDLSSVLDHWPGIDPTVYPPLPPVTTVEYPGDAMHAIAHAVNLDQQGNGYADEQAIPDATKVVSVRFNVQDPPATGYHKPPSWGDREENGSTRIVFFGGEPGTQWGFTAFVLD